MPQTILGIDVGSYSVKVAEMERTFREFQLVGFFEQPIMNQETLGKEVATRQALVKIFEEYNLPVDFVYTALPGQITSHRVIDLPFADFKKVDATIEFEMESYLPLPLEEGLIDYELLQSTKNTSSVLVSYTKKSDVVKFLNLTNEANLDPRFVGSEVVEMANIMKLGSLHPEGAYAILDIGHEKTNISIFVGDKQQYVRTVMIGGRDLTQAIAESLNIPFSEAERMKIEMGQMGPGLENADSTTRSISEALQKPLSELLLYLKQTFMGFQEAKGEVVQALILCGGTSRLPGIDLYISNEARKNVSFLDCLDFPFNQLADSTWCRSIALSALALAYRGIMGSSIKDIQFRRGEFAYKGEVRDIASMTKQAAILLGVVVFFALSSFVTSYVTLKKQVKNQISHIAAMTSQVLPDVSKKTLSSPNAILSTLSGKISEGEEKRKKIDEEISLSVLDILKQFSVALPSREAVPIDIDDMSIISKRVRIQGRTNSFEAVDQIKTTLAKSKFFKNVATENVKKGLKDEVRFNLSLEVAEGTAIAGEGI